MDELDFRVGICVIQLLCVTNMPDLSNQGCMGETNRHTKFCPLMSAYMSVLRVFVSFLCFLSTWLFYTTR